MESISKFPVFSVFLIFIFPLLIITGCAPDEPRPEPIASDETDAEVFGKYYPFHYDTFLKTKEMEATRYGGSVNYSYVERFPHLVRIFGGVGYGLDYNRARGHYWALEDMLEIKRSPKFATCMTCKSANAPKMMEEMGDAYYTTPLDEVIDTDHMSMSCSDCHNPADMELRITRPALKEALERRGTNVEDLSRNDMRTMVCAQCHVEYYFHPDPEDRKVIFPWDEGFDPADMERYFDYKYRDMDRFAETGFYDYIHPQAKVPLRIIQHPEFEMFQGSTHQAAGVSCADCHMPHVEVDGRKEISHHITSPLKYVEQTCGQCHYQDPEWLKERVYAVQERTMRLRERAENAMLIALDALEAASNNTTADKDLLFDARENYTSAHLRWQYVKAENSIGWHNPQKTLESLGESIDYAHMAREKALKSVNPGTDEQ